MENKNVYHCWEVREVSIAGLGEISRVLAKRLDAGDVERCKLVAVSGRDPIKTQSFIETLNCVVPNVALNRLGALADVVIECAPAAVLPQIVQPALSAGKKVIVLSVGALLDQPELMRPVPGEGQILKIGREHV